MQDELPDLRTIIDETAPEVFDAEESLQPRMIAERTSGYLERLLAQQPQLTDEETDRVLEGLVSGILRRLAEIESGGGQIGSS